MKERPVLFNADMVNAIIDGRKTQTRRAIKGSPIHITTFIGRDDQPNGDFGFHETYKEVIDKHIKCPYGKIGDQLWVRETHCFDEQLDKIKVGEMSKYEPIHYCADNIVRRLACAILTVGRKRPSIFMPRWASRIQLEITDIRVERLSDISEIDACSEGAPTLIKEGSHKEWFKKLWQSINGAESWENNPWVWVIEFKRIDA